jgi:glutamine synthetase
MEDSADHMILAKWVLRMLGYQYGTCISFAPKITVGKAGSGMHIHMKLMKNGKNMMIENGVLSQNAKKAIAGILDLAPSLTAFGNTIPTSYLRLVPHQEAPTNICWGDRNRSVLVRVPLGWLGNASKMIHEVNPQEKVQKLDFSDKQTVEFRCPDGSANIYLLMAGLAVAVRHGLEMENALTLAEKLYVNVNIFKEENKAILEKLGQLPLSCFESAEKLIQQKDAYLKYGVFTEGILENFASELKQFNDKDLSEKLYGKHDKIRELVEKFMHCA